MAERSENHALAGNALVPRLTTTNGERENGLGEGKGWETEMKEAQREGGGRH